jgi:PIN domain nuclease of toxin-antitoxin system
VESAAEVKLLLDTHIWLWSLTAPDRLARKVRTQLERKGNEVWLSPISVWELLVLAERGRVRLDAEPRAWVAEALERAPLEEAALNHEVALRSREVSLPHQDPADRFLVATALTYELTLVTADEMLIVAKACPTLPNR